MIDMYDLVKKFFYHPLTGGSNSIKKVLPAILSDSDFLKKKYGHPIYGSNVGPKSLNFKAHQWINIGDDGKVKDPYKLLPPVFDDYTLEQLDARISDDTLADGGAAMTAYARMQFTEMSDIEVKAITNALLKYCELDTFAMVMIYEYWKHEVESKRASGRVA